MQDRQQQPPFATVKHIVTSPGSQRRNPAGVAFAHLLRQGAPVLRAEPCSDGWLVSGTAYITGWGDVDVVLIAARRQDPAVWERSRNWSETISASMLELAAVNSSSTAVITFDQHLVTTDDVTPVVSFDSWLESYHGPSCKRFPCTWCHHRCLSPGRATSMTNTPRLARLDTASVDELPAAANARPLYAFGNNARRRFGRRCSRIVSSGATLRDRQCSCSYRAKRAKFGTIS